MYGDTQHWKVEAVHYLKAVRVQTSQKDYSMVTLCGAVVPRERALRHSAIEFMVGGAMSLGLAVLQTTVCAGG